MDRIDVTATSTGDIDDRDLYRDLVEAITDYAIYRLNIRGEVASWNAGAQRIKGYTAAEILGQHFSRFYTPEEIAEDLPARALRLASKEGRFEREAWRVRKDGSRFWAHVIIDPIRDSSGTLVGYAKITRDLTEQKRVREELARSEESFRRLVMGVTDYAIYMLDPGGIVTNWNVGAERIKGYRPHEILGQHFSRFYTEEDRAAGLPERALRDARENGHVEFEGWRVRKDGTRFWASVVIDAIRNEEGELLGFAKITRDVTERIRAQRELERAREQLFQAQKMESIGQLSGGIAHDFNNLLSAVLGSLELLRKHLPEDERMQRLLDNAVSGAERGVSLTRRILAFARRQELKPIGVDLAAVVRGMQDLLEPSLGPGITLQTRFPPEVRPAHTDPNQIETALLNLVVNARDAMPEGGHILVEVHSRTIRDRDMGLPAGSYVCLSVTDTGTGMDEEVLSHALEPFFTTKGIGKGTGLGLSMVHGLAEQSGGKLVLRSKPGEGTTVELWLPAADKVGEAENADAETMAAPAPEGLRVLAVDDDPLVLMNTVAMLEDLGHTVLEARTGAQALNLVRKGEALDVVITDHAMPQMTGAELAEALHVERPGLPVVMATGYAEMPPGVAAGTIRLAKPFRQQELADVLRAAMCPAPS